MKTKGELTNSFRMEKNMSPLLLFQSLTRPNKIILCEVLCENGRIDNS